MCTVHRAWDGAESCYYYRDSEPRTGEMREKSGLERRMQRWEQDHYE